MKSAIVSVLAGTLFFLGCGEPSEKTATSTNASSSASSPANAPADYLRAIANGQQSAVKTVDTTSLDKAIQLFNVDNGRNPKDLNELVQKKYIAKIPDVPFGTRLVYDATQGSVQIEKQ